MAKAKKKLRARFKRPTPKPLVPKDPTAAKMAQIGEAAKQLGKRFVAKYGKKKMSELGTAGANSYWDSLTLDERSVEMRRRAAVRNTNRRERVAAIIAAGLRPKA